MNSHDTALTKDWPLLHDHHTHPLLYAAFRQGVDLSDVDSFEQAADLIAKAGGERLVIAHSWKSNRFEFELDLFNSLPPCAVFNLSLHGVLLNRAGESQLKERFGNDVERVKDQLWLEQNLRQVLNWFALLGGSPAALVKFYAYLETVGIHSAEEMLLIDGCEIDWFRETGLIDRTRFWAAPETFERLNKDQQGQVAGFKFFADGAFGARTAAVSKPYIGEPANFGMLMYQDQEIQSLLNQCSNSDIGIAIHAIGDVAIEQVLSTIEECPAKGRFREIRIEHAQLIGKDQALRTKELGIILSMQPNFNDDSSCYTDRLPEAFLAANNPFRMLIDECGFQPGVDLIFGSDGMPHGVEFAAQQAFQPPRESQRLSSEELRAGYTRLEA
jgi:predicted amidohydrolase YtcJ